MIATMCRSVSLGRVWLLVAFIRVALWTRPFVVVRRFANRWRRQTSRRGHPGDPGPEALVRAVRRVARFVPGASCLTQALAAEVLLRRAGYSPRLRIGCRRDEAGELSAHAWVELMGQVLGNGEAERFTPLPALEKP
jgi:hypothetical protein